MTDLAAFAVFGAGLLTALAVGEALRAWAGWAPESSRRVVHALVGVETALSPLLFAGPGWIYALAVGFAAVNVVASPRGVFAGMHGIRRRSWGTVTFPVALVAGLWLCWTLDASRVFALQAAFLVLALADPAASLVGTRVARPGRYAVAGETKSLAGSAAFAVVAGAATALAVAAFGPGWTAGEVAAAPVGVAAVATAAEALGRAGWDNLWIVLATMTVLAALHHGAATPETVLWGVALAGAFGVAAWRARSLDTSGALAAGVLAWLVVAVGGAAWAVPIFGFFALSSALSRLGRRRKRGAEALAEKGSRRDAGQVVANGGVAGALLAATVFADGSAALYAGFLGALAAAAADTWATEIGTLVGGPTRRLGVGPRVPPGTSGGMSVGGTVGTVLGAASVAACALPFGALSPRAAGWVVAAGVAGSLADTVLGATVQARFGRPGGGVTERRVEGGVALPLAGGVAWVGNDAVNLACTVVGAAVAAALVTAGG